MSREEIQSRSFSELFNKIEASTMPEDVFTLVNSDYTVITTGDKTPTNSMVVSWGGWGILSTSHPPGVCCSRTAIRSNSCTRIKPIP